MNFISYKNWLNEVFTKDSDPITDMGVGGIIPYNHFKNFINEYQEKWIKFLQDTFEGKKVKGKFYKGKFDNKKEEYSFHVKNVMWHFKPSDDKKEVTVSGRVGFISEENNKYYNDGKDKIFIIG